MSGQAEHELVFEERSILQNLALICNRRVVVIYIVSPLIFWPWLWYVVFHLSDDGWLSPKAQFLSAIAVMLVGITFVCVEHDRIFKRLKREGYVQRRTRRREIDHFVNLAVCGGFFYWVFNGMDALEVTSEIQLGIHIAAVSFMTTVGLEYWLLGALIWFTSRRVQP